MRMSRRMNLYQGGGVQTLEQLLSAATGMGYKVSSGPSTSSLTLSALPAPAAGAAYYCFYFVAGGLKLYRLTDSALIQIAMYGADISARYLEASFSSGAVTLSSDGDSAATRRAYGQSVGVLSFAPLDQADVEATLTGLTCRAYAGYNAGSAGASQLNSATLAAGDGLLYSYCTNSGRDSCFGLYRLDAPGTPATITQMWRYDSSGSLQTSADGYISTISTNSYGSTLLALY